MYVATKNVPDDFLLSVAKVTAEIFSDAPQCNSSQQLSVIANCHRYRACCPVLLKNRDRTRNSAFPQSQYSVCDVIYAGHERRERQVMEVLEHVLHHITDVGMHYTFPAEWGLTTESALYRVMQEAIDKGLYNVKSYARITQKQGERLRVMLQEFGYWLITTAWDLQREFGHDSREWLLRSPSDLLESLPSAHALFDATVVPTLVPPKPATLRTFVAYSASGDV